MSNPKLEILKKYWGYDNFRPMQEEIIDAALSGKDALALLPTGGGKSICFQVPALVKEGICIVVSPLIALMKDQVMNLNKRGINASAIYSGMSYKDIDRILDNCIYGKTKFLYLSPERLTTTLALERLKKMNINLLAIDESHCISQWGYDFRPPYLKIADFRAYIPSVPCLALTATATPEVVLDIQEKLDFKNGQVFQKSFKRSNLSYSVFYQEGKMERLLQIIKRVPGTAVVYVRNRRKTVEIARFLLRNRITADFYHAGLDNEARTAKQAAWIEDKTRVIVSTNAFGMGIDKPDVRLVVHLDLPDNLEAYFQEAGRAGRDGKKAYAVMLYNENDILSLDKQFENTYPEMGVITRVYNALQHYYQLAVGSHEGSSFDFDIMNFCEKFKLNPLTTHHALKILEQSGWIALSDAVFSPMAIMIKVDKTILYDYQIKNPKADRLLRLLMQQYQGLFSGFCNIRDVNKIANILGRTPADLILHFKHLEKEGILEYRPPKDKPQLTFLLPIAGKNQFKIDKKWYEFRKKRQAFRIKKAKQYVQVPICRSVQLLAYFGELSSEKCGICDVCTGRTKPNLSDADVQRYIEKIKAVLKKEALSLEEILDSFADKREQNVLFTLNYMLSERHLTQTTSGKIMLV